MQGRLRSARGPTAADFSDDERGEAMLALVLAVADAFFKMRAAGRTTGGVSSWGGGVFGLLDSLIEEGPQTVPQIAARRPVARQRIQRLVNELREAGLVTLVENPRHKRSRLVTLTTKGIAAHRDIRERLLALCAETASEIKGRDIERATRVLRQVSSVLQARLNDSEGDGDDEEY